MKYSSLKGITAENGCNLSLIRWLKFIVIANSVSIVVNVINILRHF